MGSARRRVATLTVELERMEVGFAVAGEAQPAQLELYQRTANSLRRLRRVVLIPAFRQSGTLPVASQRLEAYL
jgi:hypothetical protein